VQPLIAAIYSRKSTGQTGVADEQRSVPRQIERAREYAARKGWTVTFTPKTVNGVAMYELKIPIAFDRLLVSLVPGLEAGLARVEMASPTGTDAGWRLPICGFSDLVVGLTVSGCAGSIHERDLPGTYRAAYDFGTEELTLRPSAID
jgi:hypothetical protein